MGLNVNKLDFKDKFKEAGTILIQSKTGTAKMYNTTRDNIIELVKKNPESINLGTYFTAESIKAAKKEEPKNKKDEGKNSGTTQK